MKVVLKLRADGAGMPIFAVLRNAFGKIAILHVFLLFHALVLCFQLDFCMPVPKDDQQNKNHYKEEEILHTISAPYLSSGSAF